MSESVNVTESLEWAQKLVLAEPGKFTGDIVRDPHTPGTGSVWFCAWDGCAARIYETVETIPKPKRRECSGRLSLSFGDHSTERYAFHPSGPQATAEAAKVFVIDYDVAGKPSVMRQIHPRSGLILHGPQHTHPSSPTLDRRSIYKDIGGFALWIPSFKKSVLQPHEIGFVGPNYRAPRHLRPLMLQTIPLSSRITCSVTQHAVAPRNVAAEASRAVSALLGLASSRTEELMVRSCPRYLFDDVRQWEIMHHSDGTTWVIVSTRSINLCGHALALRVVASDEDGGTFVQVVTGAGTGSAAVNTCSLTGVQLRRDLYERTGEILGRPARERVTNALEYLYG